MPSAFNDIPDGSVDCSLALIKECFQTPLAPIFYCYDLTLEYVLFPVSEYVSLLGVLGFSNRKPTDSWIKLKIHLHKRKSEDR